ncbi:MAG: hypothetical protein WAU86_20045 [Oricola sp.]
MEFFARQRSRRVRDAAATLDVEEVTDHAEIAATLERGLAAWTGRFPPML